MSLTPEEERLNLHHAKASNWKRWGPYLSHRSWGTVREDYSRDGEAWTSFPHDQARSKAYRWSEDGIGGISDRDQLICFAVALWNYRDPILKERFFGLSGKEGNHGEDLKEYYFYLDNTPTHSYMKMLYKYTLEPFPYQKLIEENRKRSHQDPEYELLDTGIFDQNSYLDVVIEYAKASEEDLLIQFTVTNRGSQAGRYMLLPTIWFRNTWSWGYPHGPMGNLSQKPHLLLNPASPSSLQLNLGDATYYLFAKEPPNWIFTENETNTEKLYEVPSTTPYVKDAFHRYLIDGDKKAINFAQEGTKAAGVFEKSIEPSESHIFQLRLCQNNLSDPFTDFEALFSLRKQEADLFYQKIQNPRLNEEEKCIQRKAFAGMLWNKQLYYFDINQWIKGDPILPLAEGHRLNPRNLDWDHLVNFDVISMPDKWEYPWYASWDLAFHCIPFALLDADFAKRQLILMTREWYMHPNGQLPSYEWNFSDVNPPVHAWAAWRVYKIDKKTTGISDTNFLKGIYNKLLLNFTWWINKKDKQGKNVFQGGFLGMDNISLFDRSILPFDGWIDQADATSWMGFYSILMMKMSLELARTDPSYEDMATKFFEHFLRIATAMTQPMDDNPALWEKEDGFFYDVLHHKNKAKHLKVRSLVGLLPLLSVETIEDDLLEHVPVFKRRMEWFLSKKPELSRNVSCMHTTGIKNRRMMAFVNRGMLMSILRYMLDENEFLSPYGIRSLSKYHQKKPYLFQTDHQTFSIQYEPGDSESGLFGGNSNWRGPIWFPINFLIIESLQKYHHYYGNTFQVEFPSHSGKLMNLGEVASELSKRLVRLFLKKPDGQRPVNGKVQKFQADPHWQDLILFHEFFHGDHGAGLGASHQTGWTGLIAKILQQCEEHQAGGS